METFWVMGYKAASLTDLTRRMGIERPSIYGAFGDKHQLFMAALDRYQTIKLEQLRAALADGGSPRLAIERVLMGTVARLRSEPTPRGCLAVNSMVELATHDAQAATSLQNYRDEVAHLFVEALDRAKSLGELAPSANPHALAYFLIVTLDGLEVLSKTRPDPAYVEDAVHIAMAALAR